MRDYAPKPRLVEGPIQEDWVEFAACAGADVDLWFPTKTRGAASIASRAARAICAGCPVRSECLEYALRNDERYGIWGGMTERQRRAVKRARVA